MCEGGNDDHVIRLNDCRDPHSPGHNRLEFSLKSRTVSVERIHAGQTPGDSFGMGSANGTEETRERTSKLVVSTGGKRSSRTNRPRNSRRNPSPQSRHPDRASHPDPGRSPSGPEGRPASLGPHDPRHPRYPSARALAKMRLSVAEMCGVCVRGGEQSFTAKTSGNLAL